MDRQKTWLYVQRLLIAVGIIGLFTILLVLAWTIADILLLLFLGVLLAIALRTLAQPLGRYTPLPMSWSVGAVILLLLALLGVGAWFFVPQLIAQTDQLVDRMSQALAELQAVLAQFGLGITVLEGIFPQDIEQFLRPNLLLRLTDPLTQSLTVLSHVLFTLFVGLFVALEPNLYRQGLVTLVPPNGRSRARQVIDKVVKGLRAWLLARLISMLAIGIVTGVGLWILGIPFAFLLGLISGLLEFIPVVGPILSAVPAIAIALTLGPMKGIYVTLFYLVIQQLEGNVLTPIVQERVVSLPPVITLAAVLIMSLLFGMIGTLTANPLAVVLFILIKMLYVRDILGSDTDSEN